MAHAHHSIDYVEIQVADVASAKEFYAAAFGWRFNDYGPDYAGIAAPDGNGEAGGLARGDQQGGHPLILLISDDLTASESAVRDAGGELVEGPYDYPGGRRFHFRDPSGNTLGVFQPAGP